MVVTGASPYPSGGHKSPEGAGGIASPEIPMESDSKAKGFDFDPSETIIVVHRKDPSQGQNRSLLLKSLLKHTSCVKGGRVEKVKKSEKIRFMKR